MRNLLVLFLLLFGNAALEAQELVVSSKSPEFLEKKARLEDYYQKRVENFSLRILGEESYLASSVEAEFGSSSEEKTLESLSPKSLTYMPQDWTELYPAGNDEVSLNRLSIRVFVRSDVNAERESILRRTLESNFSTLNLDLKFEKGNALAFADPVETNERSPASESPDPAASAPEETPKEDPLAWTQSLEPLFGPVALLLALVILSMALLRAFKAVAGGLGQAASSIANGMARAADSKSSSQVPSTLESSQSISSEVQTQFSDTQIIDLVNHFNGLLNQKKNVMLEVLGEAPDAKLLNLVEFLPYFDSDAVSVLKEILGPRAEVFEAFDFEELPSRSDSCVWLLTVIKRVHALELIDKRASDIQLSAEDLKKLRSLKGQGLLEVFESALDPESASLAQTLPELLNRKQLEDIFSQARVEDVVSVLKRVQNPELAQSSSSQTQQLSDVLRRATEKSQAPEVANSKTLSKILQSFLEVQKTLSLDEETQNIKTLMSQVPDLESLMQSQYWPLPTLLSVPETTLNPWITRLDNRLLAALMFFAHTAEELSLWTRLESLLPEGMRKTIVMDYYKKIQKGVTRQELLQWSSVLRTNIENLRTQHSEGRFELLEAKAESYNETQAA